VDIESIAALPDAEDPWEDAFYQQTFAKSEIAYCLTQEAPRQHFAARWAAKEALKKCDPAYLRAEMSDLEVVVQPDGVPSLRLRDGESSRKLPHALSLSHTDDFAVAMVVHAPAPVAPTIIRDVTPSKTEESTESQDMGDVTTNSAPASNVAPILIAMLALALAAISLIRSL
jgi:holo-[acyl-carrier protein] synthase